MLSSTDPDPEPEPSPIVLSVGQDRAGHWLVQGNDRRLEGRFVSFAVARAYAHAEAASLPGAVVVTATAPLVPIVPFAPVQPWERAMPHGQQHLQLKAAA